MAEKTGIETTEKRGMQRHKRLKHRVWKCSGQNKSKLSEANAAISVLESLTSKKRIFPLKDKNYSQL